MSALTTRSLLLTLTAFAAIAAPITESQAITPAQLRAQARAAKRLEQRQVQGGFDARSRLDDLKKKMDERRASRNRPPTDDQPQNDQPPEQPKQQPSPKQPARPMPVDGSIGSIRQQILTLVNAERQQAGLSALMRESHLESAAQKHAEDMNRRNYFEHNTPEGKTPTEQIKDSSYPLTGRWTTGQNIARGQKTAEQVMKDWMNSPGHRKNILNSSFQHLGVGYVNSHWVQDFGSHR